MKVFKGINIINSLALDKSNSLEEVRRKIIILAFSTAAIVCLLMSIIRIFEQRLDMFLISLIALLISLAFLYFSKNGYSQITLGVACLIYSIIAFREGLLLKIPPQTVLYFTVVPVINVFLMSSQKFRVSFLVLNLCFFILLNILVKTDNWSDVITFVVVTSFCFIIVLFFIRLLESQQKRLQIALTNRRETMERLKEKHEETLLFNNMMNHDIKAPLRTIKGFTALLKKRTNPTERQLEYIDFITASTENLESLIFDMLMLSKINTIDIEHSKIKVHDLINQICHSLSFDIKNKNVKIDMENFPEIDGNQELLRTVFQNIISNAIKYQPKLETHIPVIKITYQQVEQFDIIQIQDNGIGIAPENVAKLFDPFIRFHSAADYEGTGLGMTICKKIMDKHKGIIQYVPNELKGTCLKLKFPRS